MQEPDRATALMGWISFAEIVDLLARSPVAHFWWEPGNMSMVGNHRASYVVTVLPQVYDAFFNAPVGYRAQYAIAPSVGDRKNRALLDAIEPALMRHTLNGGPGVTPLMVLSSLRAIEAKVWIVESEVDEQLSGPIAIDYPPWERNSLVGEGLRAPRGVHLEVKGGWFDDGGNAQRNPNKTSRSLMIHRTGYI
jgi:hypothetical protein